MEAVIVKGTTIKPWTSDCAEHSKDSASPCKEIAGNDMTDRPPIIWGNLSAPIVFVGLNPHYLREEPGEAVVGQNQKKEPPFFRLHSHVMNKISERYGLAECDKLRRKFDSMEAELVGCGSADEYAVTDAVRERCAERFLLPAIEATRPKVIVGLGRFVVGYFCKRFDLRGFEDHISSEVGKHWRIQIGDYSPLFVACSHPNWRRFRPLSAVVDAVCNECTLDDFKAARANPTYFYYSP